MTDANDNTDGDGEQPEGEQVSPDDAERHPEFYDRMEQHSRHRVISNGGGRL